MTTLTQPSLSAYRTVHKIEPVLHPEGWQICGHCGVKVYQVLTRRWQHDINEIRRLITAETRAIVHADPVPLYVSEIADDGLGQAKAERDR